MRYLFHEPVTGLIPTPPRAVDPTTAIAAAILGTTLISVALSAVFG